MNTIKHTANNAIYLSTPLGQVMIEANEQGLTQVAFVEDVEREDERPSNALVLEAKRQLQAYFDGELTSFDLPLAPKGTEFRTKVWAALQQIPYGETACYGDIANALNNPKAVRAVGGANGANPISIIVPCHRIIGKDGSLTGYASGVDKKEWLLALEREDEPEISYEELLENLKQHGKI
ncbi:MAG: methylated-DNA-[protein]-cysteine S-methyltransferase [Phenylobacterium sp.]|jgi:methylated-DNA-[protein]-cysteine S-methyltransferase